MIKRINKKLIVRFITCILIINIFSDNAQAYRDQDVLQIKIDDEREYDYKSIIESNKSDYEKVSKLYKYLDLIPSNIIDEFIYKSCKIVLTSESLEDRFLSKYVLAGVFFDNKIYLSNKFDWSEQSIIHEMGHFVDYNMSGAYIPYANARASDAEEFLKIYEEEKNVMKLNSDKDKAYYINSSQEYFAQAFEEYILNPNRLKLNSLETYKYMNTCTKIL